MFTVGDRANATRVLVLITDGVGDDRNATWLEAMHTRSSDIDIIAVRYLPAVASFSSNF